MAYFPLFIDLSHSTCLIAGGGAVAYRKAAVLKEYGPRIVITAPKFHPDFLRQSGFFLLERVFRDDDLEGVDFVIAATNDSEENLRIAAVCRERNIPVNVVDNQKACTFLFPAMVRDEGITIGITTSGSSPDMAVCLRERIRKTLPEGIGAYTDTLGCFREMIKNVEPPAVRRAVFHELALGGLNGVYENEDLTEELVRQVIDGKLRELHR